MFNEEKLTYELMDNKILLDIYEDTIVEAFS